MGKKWRPLGNVPPRSAILDPRLLCSASGMFVRERMDNFGAVYRKAVWGFVNRLSDTDNHIPNGMFHSELAVTSGIRKAWNGALF